jgi:phytoene/squalene synthetase
VPAGLAALADALEARVSIDDRSSLPPGAELSAAEVSRRSASNFLAGFVGMDPARRRAMTAIYAFCRVVDDAVDEAPDPSTGERQLAFWRHELVRVVHGEAPTTDVGRELRAAVEQFGVPTARLDDLIDGVATDLEAARRGGAGAGLAGFADEAALDRYCYCVASAVGLACLPVFGVHGPVAERFAEALGQALQRTNILRDLRSDAQIGRCYVPRAWLAEAGVEAAWLRGDGPADAYADAGPVDRLCRRIAVSARGHFADACAELRRLPRAARRALVPARIMGAIYEALLHKLERRRGEVRAPRVRVSKWAKLRLAALVFAGVRP